MRLEFPKEFFGGRKQTALLSTGFVGRAPSSPLNKTPAFAEGAKGRLNFPEWFFWGSATSAHQVEGGNHNDWTEWEAQSAKFKVQSAKLKVWPEFILKNYPNPLQKENYISGRACDHYNRFREDFDIAKQLGHNAHRFSIEWSRIEPEEGKFDEKEIEHYREVIKALRERGMEPFVTLWHWTIPVWLRDIGGWENQKTIDYFQRFADKVAHAYPEVRFWIILNEPMIYAFNCYLRGKWPPQKRSFLKFLKVLKNLADAHRRIYSQVLKNTRIVSHVGIAKNNIFFEGSAASCLNFLWNEWFLNKIRDHFDFIGLNFYFHNRVKLFRLNQNENKSVSDMGWEIYPEGIYHVLKELKKYNKPIYITENGLADARDIYRREFIKEHIRYIAKAIQEGADVRGYFYWSLLDNFEWHEGFWPRFGLVEIDYETLERRIRPSAYAYRDIIVGNES